MCGVQLVPLLSNPQVATVKFFQAMIKKIEFNNTSVRRLINIYTLKQYACRFGLKDLVPMKKFPLFITIIMKYPWSVLELQNCDQIDVIFRNLFKHNSAFASICVPLAAAHTVNFLMKPLVESVISDLAMCA